MISGAHIILYSKDPEADRAFFKDVLKFKHVDVGHGWLLFSLPPAELAVHPGGQNGETEFYLMCDDIEAFVKEMKAMLISCDPVTTQRWGLLTQVTLPGGSKIGVYQPLHERPGLSKET